MSGRAKSAVLSVMIFVSAVQIVRPASITVGLSAHYQFSPDALYRRIYGSGTFLPSASLAWAFGRWEFRGEAGITKATGEMTESGEKISLRLTSYLFGVRYKVLDRTISPYLGFGAGLLPYAEDYPDRFEDVNGSTGAIYGEGGTLARLRGPFRLDINIRYVRGRAKAFDAGKVHLGGVRLGLGIGYRF